MKLILLQVLDYERDLVYRTRAEGKIIIRPSTLIVLLLFILYALSPIDIVPEKWVKPFIFGIVDDLILFAVTVIYTYRDWGELFDAEIPTFNLRRSKPDRESEVPMADGYEEGNDSRIDTVDSSDNHSDVASEMGRDIIPSIASTDNDIGGDNDVTERSSESGETSKGDGGEDDDGRNTEDEWAAFFDS